MSSSFEIEERLPNLTAYLRLDLYTLFFESRPIGLPRRDDILL